MVNKRDLKQAKRRLLFLLWDWEEHPKLSLKQLVIEGCKFPHHMAGLNKDIRGNDILTKGG